MECEHGEVDDWIDTLQVMPEEARKDLVEAVMRVLMSSYNMEPRVFAPERDTVVIHIGPMGVGMDPTEALKFAGEIMNAADQAREETA